MTEPEAKTCNNCKYRNEKKSCTRLVYDMNTERVYVKGTEPPGGDIYTMDAPDGFTCRWHERAVS